MMRSLLLSLSFLGCATAWAQVSVLETTNPAPRVGDEVEILFSIKKENLSTLEGKDKKSSDDFATLRSNKIAYGDLKISQVFSDTGKVKIGPFRFSILDKEYETNSLTLRVYPKLSDQIKDGLWVRSVDFGGQSYLIIEQRISSEWEIAKFAQLDRDRLEAAGLDIVTSTSKSESQVLDKKNSIGSAPVKYKISTYKFKRSPRFKGKVKIDKNYFIDFPSNVPLDELWVKS